jgi:basic membrane protein A and related proteins
MNTRRWMLRSAAAVLAVISFFHVNSVFAQNKLKVAAIYTVPFEQQWVSRTHKALNAAQARGEIEYKASENVANADY